MKTKILSLLLPTLVDMLVKSFPESEIKYYLDRWIDLIEVRIETSKNEIDDALLPILVLIREVFDIPDNDKPAASKK